MRRSHRGLIYSIVLAVGFLVSESRAQTTLPAAKTLITLHFNDVPPKDVLADINKQSHFEVAPYSDAAWKTAPDAISMDADAKPYWAVMQDFLFKTGFTLARAAQARDRGLLMTNGNTPKNTTILPQQSSGAFFFEAGGIVRSSRINFGQGGTRETDFAMSLRMFVDPAVDVLGVKRGVFLSKAVDEKGHSLIPQKQPENRPQPPAGARNIFAAYIASVPLYEVPNMGNTLTQIAGAVTVMLPTKETDWTFDDVFTSTGGFIHWHGGKYVIHEFSAIPNRSGYRLVVEVHRDQPVDGERINYAASDPEILQRMIRLTDEQGREFLPGNITGGITSGAFPPVIDMSISFAAPGGADAELAIPKKLVWRVIDDTADIPVPFEFHGLPLP